MQKTQVRYEWDKSTKGLGIRIYANGRRSFVFKGQHQGKVHFLTIGSDTELSVLKAKRIAERMHMLLKSGADPKMVLFERKNMPAIQILASIVSGRIRAERKLITLGSFSAVYLEKHAKQWKKSWKKDKQYFTYMNTLWNLPLILISRTEVECLHRNLSANSKHMANRTVELLRVMFRYAEEWGYVPENHKNPAARIRLNKLHSKDRFVTKEERPRLDAAIDAYPDLRVQTALRMILWMGYRHQEVLKLRWEYFDSAMTMIRIPDTKNGKPHIMPIPAILLPDLMKLKNATDGPYVFPGKMNGTSMACLDKPWRKIRVEAGIPDVTVHDLRRTFASDCIRRGVDLYTISRLLNQGSAYVTSIYAKHDIEPLRDILNANAGSKPNLKVVAMQNWKERENGK